MGLFRLLIIFFIGYFVLRFIRKLMTPPRQNPHVQGQSEKRDIYKDKKNIQDADYEELE
jgi:hypothetical protein